MIKNLVIAIKKANLPEEIFGPYSEHMKDEYKYIIGKIHPDKQKNNKEMFTELFQKVQKLKIEAEIRVKEGIYGTTISSKVEFDPVIIRTKRNSYTLTSSLNDADICNVYKCTDKDKTPLIFKSAKIPGNNDLVLNEINTLNKIKNKFHHKMYSKFYSELFDSFKIINKDKKKLQIAILPDYRDKGYVSLLDVRHKFENELDPRHIVWIFKRLLMAIGHIHNNNIVHGSLIPPHILVHPVDHSIKIIDWSYSITGSNKISVISNKYSDFYPSEVFEKEISTGITDIYTIVKTMQYLCRGNTEMPLFMKRFFKGCLSHRSYDAWDLHEEFDGLVHEFYGKPKYVLMEI